MTLYVTRVTKPGKLGLVEFECETLEEVAKEYYREYYNTAYNIFSDQPFIDVSMNVKLFEITGNIRNDEFLYVTNHRDNIISVGMIISAIDTYYNSNRRIRSWETRIHGTKRWSKRFRYYRRPGTIQERRNNQYNKFPEEGEPKSRPARNNKNLVDSYSDLRRSDIEIRSWKQYRKTQWKLFKKLR